MSRAVLACVIVIGLGFGTPSPSRAFLDARIVAASNLGFLRNAPITRFNETDTELFRTTTLTALEQARDGEKRQWSNPDTGSSGEISVVRTFTESNVKCRELAVTNRADGLSHSERMVFCYDTAKARWMLRPGTSG